MKQKVVGLFPGQGSQSVGMIKELHDEFKIVKETFEEASDASGLHIKKLCFEGPENELTLTKNTQPCLLTASIASFRLAQRELGFEPVAVAGHSLGEYSALVAAGAFPFSSAVKWVRARGAAMQKAVPAGQGTMAAVMGLDDDLILALCKKATDLATQKRKSGEASDLTVDCLVSPANFNAPGQTVIAGSQDAVTEAVLLVKADETFKGGKAIPLSVSAPFHCALMKPARDEMAKIFKNAQDFETPKKLLFPYVPNRTARINPEPSSVFDLLIDQVDHEVRWRQSVETMIEQDWQWACEFGPGKVLQGLAKRISQPTGKNFTATGFTDLNSLKLFETWLKT
jgi:[acyl-carrier-protein] S-malonyltransferase